MRTRKPVTLAVAAATTAALAGFLVSGPTHQSDADNVAAALAIPSASASASASASPSPTTPSPSPSTVAPTPSATRTKTATKAPAPKPSPTASKGPRTFRLSPVTAIGSQAAIDQCKLVLWMTDPTYLIAAHNSCGYSWLDDIPTGSIVIVTRGPAAGKYKVVGHRWQSTKGGPVPSWMAGYDLVLQTCTAHGMGFSLAQRI